LTLDFGTQFAGQAVQLRFRIGTDTLVGGRGWIIDDIEATGITNTPFSIIVPEPSKCNASARVAEDDDEIRTSVAPATSLGSYDAAVCIARDV
jgi:hypothetical protein